MAVLEVERLEIDFEVDRGKTVHAVRGVDLQLDAGERLGLVGESGCGKTTTLLALMGLLPPSAAVNGDVRLEGRSVIADGEASAQRVRWRDIAMVFQGAMN